MSGFRTAIIPKKTGGIMVRKDIISMSLKEIKRLGIINKVIERSIKQTEAAKIIGLSARQIRRICNRVEEEGERGIVHRSRGEPSNRSKPLKFKNKIIELCKTKYLGFNPTFASEKLLEEEKLEIHPETLRLWFNRNQVEYKQRKGREHRQWRERKWYRGEMVQLDGSHHNWLEGRGSDSVLMGYIDDATGICSGRFYAYEGTQPALDSFKRYIKKYGIPQSVYLDKHNTYKSPKELTIEEQLANKKALSQFERAMAELGVKVIHADSPQAKGRIERSFETHQDRLIKEMRLKGIKTNEEANKFLDSYYFPKHNRKFSVAAKKEVDLHRPIPEGMDLDKILCIKEEAALRNDFTVVYKKNLYQVFDSVNTRRVTVEERTNGQMFITYKNQNLKYKQIPIQPKKINYKFNALKTEITNKTKKIKTIWIPPANHPWRHSNYYYNCKRSQSTLDYLSPFEYEKQAAGDGRD